MSKTPDPAADLLPARMLNEFVYCPRLFYYEHVEGVFLHSADTKKGAVEHTRVDAGRGELPKAQAEGLKTEKLTPDRADVTDPTPAPAAEEATSESVPPAAETEVIHARSVMLGSESLGVVAKLDLVEVTLDDAPSAHATTRAQRVCPVEYKAGAPRESDDGRQLWDADRMQLGLQILLLRENGYSCDEGVVFYRQTRQRVRFVLTPEDEAWIRRGISAARACTSGPIPPPLDHSPKCPRCSLAPVCLPDETQFLRFAEPDLELPDRARNSRFLDYPPTRRNCFPTRRNSRRSRTRWPTRTRCGMRCRNRVCPASPPKAKCAGSSRPTSTRRCST